MPDWDSQALEDYKTTRPAIMMYLTSIAEQFTKLKDSNILNQFDKSDIKGAIDTRNFIAHDYEGINLPIIEFIIRDKLIFKSNNEFIYGLFYYYCFKIINMTMRYMKLADENKVNAVEGIY